MSNIRKSITKSEGCGPIAGGHLAAIFSRTVAVGAQCSKTKKLIADWIIWNDFWSVFRLSTANQRQISNHYGFWLVGRRWEEAGIVFNMGHSKHLDEHFSNEFATYYKRWKNIFKNMDSRLFNGRPSKDWTGDKWDAGTKFWVKNRNPSQSLDKCDIKK